MARGPRPLHDEPAAEEDDDEEEAEPCSVRPEEEDDRMGDGDPLEEDVPIAPEDDPSPPVAPPPPPPPPATPLPASAYARSLVTCSNLTCSSVRTYVSSVVSSSYAEASSFEKLEEGTSGAGADWGSNVAVEVDVGAAMMGIRHL